MRVLLSGNRNGVPWPPVNEVLDLPDAEAAELCASGLAEPVVDTRAERATAPTPEKRTQ